MNTLYLLSYPRSGNHLLRTFLEHMLHQSTTGCRGSPTDTPIHKRSSQTRAVLQAQIQADAQLFKTIQKSHFTDGVVNSDENALILLQRNPREALLSHTRALGQNDQEHLITLLQCYADWKGPKLMVYYEDLKDKTETTLHTIGEFLGASEADIQETTAKQDILQGVALGVLHRKQRSAHQSEDFYAKTLNNSNQIAVPRRLYSLVERYSCATVVD